MTAMKMDAKFYGVIFKAKDDTPVPPDEWICFLVKDNAFAAILPLYRDKCVEFGCDAEQIASVERMMERVTEWRANNLHRLKRPDAAHEKLLV